LRLKMTIYMKQKFNGILNRQRPRMDKHNEKISSDITRKIVIRKKEAMGLCMVHHNAT